MKVVEHNIPKIKHLLEMYRMDVQEFLEKISTGLKNPITKNEIFGKDIKITYLKRIDKIFEKGLHYYLDPKVPKKSKESSIFFRKQNFQNDKLNLGAIKRVNEFEELKLSLSAIAKLSDLDLKRQIKKYTTFDKPREIASEIRRLLDPRNFVSNKRNFLKELISALASKDIMVFEFVETWNKKEKANIDGFYLKPNMIVLKRQQSFSREIFTLAHELGHYLLDEEEIEEINEVTYNNNLSNIEKWCNDFAFFFLAGTYVNSLDTLENASSENNYHRDSIENISRNTHLSQLAIYTRLLYNNQISQENYSLVREEFEEKFKQQEAEKEIEKQLKKEQGIPQRGSTPKPILSPLFTSTVQTAYYEGILNEYEVCKTLDIKPKDLVKYIR